MKNLIVKYLALLCFVSFQSLISAQNIPDILWEITIDNGVSNELGRDICEASDGGFVIAGAQGSSTLIVKTDIDGNIVWSKNYVIGSMLSVPWAIQKTSDNGYIITGQMLAAGYTYDYFLLRLDETGDSLWSKTYNNEMDDDARAVLETSDGGFIVAGYSVSCDMDFEIFIVRTDSFGEIIWTNSYGNPDNTYAYAIEQTDDGYITAGKIFSGSEYYSDIYAVKINNDGVVQWTNSYGNQYNDMAQSITATADGGFILGGESRLEDTNTGDAYFVKINADGDTLWTKIYGGIHDDETCNSIIQTDDNGFMAIGYRRIDPSSLTRAWMLRLDETGDTIWTQYYGPAYWTLGSSIIKTSDTGYIFTGTASDGDSSGDWDFYVVNLSSEGSYVEDLFFERNIKIYPNPTTGIFTVENNDIQKTEIIDIAGKLIFSEKNINKKLLIINLENQPTGIYFVKIHTNKKLIINKLIINK